MLVKCPRNLPHLCCGNVASLGKCYGSHSKGGKDKYNDKCMGKPDKDKNVKEERITGKFSNRLQRHPVSGIVTY